METGVLKMEQNSFDQNSTKSIHFSGGLKSHGGTTHQTGGLHFKVQKKNSDPFKNLSPKMLLLSWSYTVDRLLDCKQPLWFPWMLLEFLSCLILTIFSFLSLIILFVSFNFTKFVTQRVSGTKTNCSWSNTLHPFSMNLDWIAPLCSYNLNGL